MLLLTNWGQLREEPVCGRKSGFHFVFLEGTQELWGRCLCDWAQRGAGDSQPWFRRPQQGMWARERCPEEWALTRGEPEGLRRASRCRGLRGGRTAPGGERTEMFIEYSARFINKTYLQFP